MAEVNTPRVMAAAKEFNIGTHTLTDFLVSKGFETDDLKPNSKITEEMYRVLQVEFQTDKVAKQKAEQIDLPKNAVTDFRKRRDAQDLSFTKKETEKAKEVTHVPEAIKEDIAIAEPPPAAKEEVIEKVPEKPTPEITKIDAPETEVPKVIDKIDLSTIDSSTRPKKDLTPAAAKKKEADTKAVTAKQKADQP